jgi:hypothetical protein
MFARRSRLGTLRNAPTSDRARCSLSVLAASGPVRLFTPYKRRRKAQSDNNDSMNSSGNGTTTVTITTPPISTNASSFNLKESTTIINNNTTQQLHIQTTPIQNSINNNNTVTINANNGIKKKRFSINLLNVKHSGADSSDDIETENITFAPAQSTPAVKEETHQPWSNVTVSEAIQEIPTEYVVDQSCKFAA